MDSCQWCFVSTLLHLQLFMSNLVASTTLSFKYTLLILFPEDMWFQTIRATNAISGLAFSRFSLWCALYRSCKYNRLLLWNSVCFSRKQLPYSSNRRRAGRRARYHTGSQISGCQDILPEPSTFSFISLCPRRNSMQRWRKAHRAEELRAGSFLRPPHCRLFFTPLPHNLLPFSALLLQLMSICTLRFLL